MSRTLADALDKLLAGEGSTAATLFTPAQRRELDVFARQTSAIRRLVQGRGVSYQLTDMGLAQAHLNVLRPVAKAQLDPLLPVRANLIARRRNSKGGSHGHGTGYLLLKAVGPDVAWQRGDGISVDISGTMQSAGVASIAITPADGWHSEQPVWLVENQALFDRLDWLPSGAHGSVIYYGGQLSNLLLGWLAQRRRTARIMFFPDYDGVGLLNYCRLVEKSQSECEFWLMPGWQDLLRKYGSNSVWQSTSKEFNAALVRLEQRGMPPELSQLCQYLSSHGLALEHETVWLKA